MVRFLLLLTFLLISPIRSNDVQANTACYCTYYPGDERCHVNTTCWACAPGAYDPNWQSTFCLGGYQAPAPTCQQISETQTLSCQANYSGQITQTRIKTCPDNQWQAWQTTQNSCVANPPTCQTSSQQQTLSCQTGYTGSIIQTRLLTCPNPYSPAVINPWTTTTNTCKKSVNNPTNPASPVSPLSPTSATSAPTIQSSPVTAPTPNTVQNSETTPTASTETQTQTTTASPTTSTTQVSPSPPPKGKVRSSVGLALSLELFVKPGLQQPNVFSEPQLVSGIPNNILTQDLIMMDLLQQPSYNQSFDAPDLGFEQ